MWWLTALRGLRRGEAAGLHWIDVDLDQHVVMIEQQRIAFGRTVETGPPKTKASRRTIGLDRTTTRLLRAHLRHQQAEYEAAGRLWHDTGHVSPPPAGFPCTRTGSPAASVTSSTSPGYRRCGCTTCGTAPPPWPTRPARI